MLLFDSSCFCLLHGDSDNEEGMPRQADGALNFPFRCGDPLPAREVLMCMQQV